MENKELEYMISLAKTAQQNAYSPYYNFKVGSCLKAKSGKYYVGSNVENAASCGICAERSACTNAVTMGEREFESIIIVSDSADPTPPCGVCRQFFSEFGLDLEVYCIGIDKIKKFSLKELLPESFNVTSISHK